jgi:hypothetical protein
MTEAQVSEVTVALAPSPAHIATSGAPNLEDIVFAFDRLAPLWQWRAEHC